jgi:hypothetical protein
VERCPGTQRKGIDIIDAVRVGDPIDLPLGTPDPAILIWAQREARVLVTDDKKSMPAHLLGHLLSGHHSPGIFVIRSQSSIPQLVSFLASVANTSEPSEFSVQRPLPNRRMGRYHGRIALIGVRRVGPGNLLQSFDQTI